MCYIFSRQPQFVVIRSRDAAGNPSLRFGNSFTTGTSADVSAPVISNVVSFVGTSTLRFIWNTNELSTSKVFYSTTTPMNVSSASTPFVQNMSLVTSHDMTLTGLATSTAYRIMIQSKDASGNTGGTNEFSITTSSQ